MFIKRVKKVLRDNEGATYIEMAIGILVITLLLSFAIKFIPVLVLKNQLNTFASYASRIIAVEGRYDASIQQIIEQYRSTNQVGAVTISVNGTNFISGTDKIQLNDLIVVTVTTEYDIGILNFGRFPITLKNTANARSGVYWK